MARRFLTSITRNSDLATRPFEVRPLRREEWASGDYVVCEVTGKPGPLYRIELLTGRRTHVLPGDLVVGAFGRRAATLECVGDWREIGDDLRLHQLTAAGMFGRVTSNSSWVGRPMELLYRGHAMRNGKLNMADFVAALHGPVELTIPVVLVAGSSMSAGKTQTGRTIIHLLKQQGLRVTAVKLTGAAGHKDALSYGDAGADHIFDYVDAGLPSTVCASEVYEAGLERLLALVAGTPADVVVGELGASPREPYSGMIALERLKPHVRVTALCASDGYAALGFREACGWQPDFVTGPAANNSASVALVRELTGLPALDLSTEEGAAALRALLEEKLHLPGDGARRPSGRKRSAGGA